MVGLSSRCVAVLALLCFCAIVDATTEPYQMLYLRAMSYMRAVPSFSNYLDRDAAGYAGINRTDEGASYEGFPSYIASLPTDAKPLVSGPLFKNQTTGADIPACLVPAEGMEYVYDLVFRDNCAEETGALYKDFMTMVIECGGNCGGLGIGYNVTNAFPDTSSNVWLVHNVSTPEYAYGKKIRYYRGGFPLPTDHYEAYMWRQ